MGRKAKLNERLRRDLTSAIVLQTGAQEQMAMVFANAVMAHLQQEYAGSYLYIPAPSRQYDLQQLTSALRAGETPQQVARRYNTTVRQLHRLFPGGLPKASDRAA